MTILMSAKQSQIKHEQSKLNNFSQTIITRVLNVKNSAI